MKRKLFGKELHNSVTSEKSQRSKEIDGFRAISVVMVVLAHLGIKASPGQTGVLFFFVISGYVITKSVLNEITKTKQFSLSNFYKRRGLKIIPPLLLIIIIPSILLAKQLQLSFLNITSQLFFYYNWQYLRTGIDGILPGSQVVWSLSVEEQYYIMIALVVTFLLLIPKLQFIKCLTGIYLLIFSTSFLARILVYLRERSESDFGDLHRILYGTDTRISSIATGGLVAIFLNSNKFSGTRRHYSRKIKLMLHISLAILAIFSVLYRDDFFRNTLKYTSQEIVCAVLIFLVTNPDRTYNLIRSFLLARVVQLIGVASYSIYLSHMIFIYWFENSNFLSILGVKGLLAKFSLLCVVLPAGILLHFMVDKPFENKRNSFRSKDVLNK